VVSYYAPNGRYAMSTNFFDNTYTNGPLSAPGGSNGVFLYGADGFPDSSYNSSNYWVDTLFVPGSGTCSSSPSPSPSVTTSPTVSPSPTTSPTASPSPTTSVPPVELPADAKTVFATNAVPANASWNDPGALEIGLRFKTDSAGKALGVRFYKGALNTGTHTGTLWTDAGAQITTGTFVGETASGWQNMLFSTPVTLTPNTWYVVSYHTEVGYYAVDGNGLGNSGVDNPPLHVDINGARYTYGAGGAFPGSASPHNYWVDVIFKPDAS
jgi:hypothetical protein